MQIHNEISFDNFYAISRFAAGAGGQKVRSYQDDRWLRSTGPSAYQSVYDPSLGRLATSWWEPRPHLIMLCGEARPDLALSFPIRASQDIVGSFVGTNIGVHPTGAAPEGGQNPSQTFLFPSILPRGSEMHLTISAGAPAFFFGIFGTQEALKEEFAIVRCLAGLGRPGMPGAAQCGIRVGQEVLVMVLQMLRNPYQGPALDAYLVGKALEILSLSHHSAENSTPVARAEQKKSPVSFICRELARIPDENLVLSEFARYLGISERTLSRQFKAETGMTFSAYQRRCRMELAARLLATGTGTTTQIASDVGYSALTAFFRAFRDHFGMTPDQYRRVQLH